ncbi:hypothetical protein L6164_022169 [Bauhinia variegata]|uniref:Uncharacterized protein n=1 Tax=Bauhinia variegata TaxID=167791 RepID=A0ACB9MEA3_BAUVA|nr:hypothetical protein L6164_022169 [Bauhinia variegata]
MAGRTLTAGNLDPDRKRSGGLRTKQAGRGSPVVETMGYLLKEALKTLCGRNQWSYAVFWKIGCHNPKLLIWEECYYEPSPCPFPPSIAGIVTSNLPFEDGEGCWFSSYSRSSQLGIQGGDRVSSLIEKMMANNSVNIAGEGIIGQAAFTGNYHWIILNNFTRDAYSPEVYNEVYHQFSAGIQTVVIIPVLPHGVVQLGSFSVIMENMGFVNDVKSLVLQLGRIPGALLSEDYLAKASIEKHGAPVTVGLPVSVVPPVICEVMNCTPSLANGSNQQITSSNTARRIFQPSYPLNVEINNDQGSVLTRQTPDMTQISSNCRANVCQPKASPMMKPNFPGQQEDRVVGLEVISSNLDSCAQQQNISYNARSANRLAGFVQSGLGDSSIQFIEEQMLSGSGNQNHVNSNINASSTISMSQLKANGGHMLDHCQSSVSTTSLRGFPVHGAMSNILRPNLTTSSVSNPPKVAASDFSGIHKAVIGLQNEESTKAGVYSVFDLASHSGASHIPQVSDQKNLPGDLKRAYDELAPKNQMIDHDLHQALKIPSLHLENVSRSDSILVHDGLNNDGTSQSVWKMNAKYEAVCVPPSSGDDLFDVLGVDFKNKLLEGNWNKLLADESDTNVKNLEKVPSMNVQGINPNCYSVSEGISDSGVFSGRDTDHLLDAVVSRAQSVAKQVSDDMSCRTTLTRISSASVPSNTHKQVMTDHIQGGLFDFPKTEGKTSAAETNSLRSGCSKDDPGKCSQTTSIYGSQLSSWVKNASNVKCENSVSTGCSRRPDEVGKTNRKRLKPGENPRPRPRDRQMIQDHVKELRQIVPNGAKCSIDALLERTIKHMLFLQSVTKHADKLKQTGDSKIVSKDGGLLLKDNFEGGATWAYEVGSQSMICPIIVEDLNPPRQMLVKMLCEERGFFLELADLIRGLGLTILKGVMEVRNDKIWARFAVEANRDVTRMEIFMSLVPLLQQTVKGNASSSNGNDNKTMVYHSFPQATQISATTWYLVAVTDINSSVKLEDKRQSPLMLLG